MAGVKVMSDGASKAHLWLGARGKVTAYLNGQQVMQEENITRYRIGQFQKPVELRSGENMLTLQVEASAGDPQVSAISRNPHWTPGVLCRRFEWRRRCGSCRAPFQSRRRPTCARPPQTRDRGRPCRS